MPKNSLGRWMLMVSLVSMVSAAPGPAPARSAPAEAGPGPQLLPATAPAPQGGGPALIYFSDFESNDGGWTAAPAAPVVWEWGTVATGIYEGCDSTPRPEPPTGAVSGTKVWATNLNGCYPNSNLTHTLSLTLDLSGAQAPLHLSFWHWYEVFETFDYAKVVVNGDELWRTPNSVASDGWQYTVVDLGAYAGNPAVTITFLLRATTVVNRSGWYLDDVAVGNLGGIEMVKTVGTDHGSCATTTEIFVPLGTPVFYCYEITNTGLVTVTTHTVTDDKLGTLLNNLPFLLAPGASVFFTATTTLTQTTVNTAEWTVTSAGEPYTVTVSATDTAVVHTGETFLPLVLKP